MPYDITIGRNSEDKKLFQKRGLLYMGKGYVKMGQYTSLSNRILMDMARSHVVLVAGKRGCLTGETMVFTDKGYKPIRDFDETQDKILSFNKEMKKFGWEDAKLLRYPLENEELIKIELSDGREIRLTKEHPLLSSYGKYIDWREAKELKTGDKIVLPLKLSEINRNKESPRVARYINEKLVCRKINSISSVLGVSEVYDLSVPKNHSFIANGIISHNSGKSYTLGVIAEEISNLPKEEGQNVGSLIFDTMGIYWTMKYRNEKDKALLEQWKLKPKNLPVKIFVPFGHYESYVDKGIPVDEGFALDITEMKAEDWILTFGLDIINPVAVLIQRVMTHLRERLRNKFDLRDIISELSKDEKSPLEVRNAAVGLFEAAETWGIFAEQDSSVKPTKVRDLVAGGKTTVLDLSVYNSVGAFNIRALVISLLSRKIFNERMSARKKEETEAVGKSLSLLATTEKKEYPLAWIFIDEAHEFLPLKGKTVASDALIQLLREGRQPGISLVLATQQPGQIHRDVMTQSDIVIAHRVTSKDDLDALNYIMQSYVLESIQEEMNELPTAKGSAIILDDNSERIYPMRIRPRFTWHGGQAPTAIRAEKNIEEF